MFMELVGLAVLALGTRHPTAPPEFYVGAMRVRNLQAKLDLSIRWDDLPAAAPQPLLAQLRELLPQD